MKKLFLSAAIAVTAMFTFAPVTATAGDSGCCDPKCCKRLCCKKETVEVCRRCFSKTVCECGCTKTINYIEVTYCTTDCCGKSKTWTKVYRA